MPEANTTTTPKEPKAKPAKLTRAQVDNVLAVCASEPERDVFAELRAAAGPNAGVTNAIDTASAFDGALRKRITRICGAMSHVSGEEGGEAVQVYHDEVLMPVVAELRAEFRRLELALLLPRITE